jgi:hypothetical protein
MYWRYDVRTIPAPIEADERCALEGPEVRLGEGDGKTGLE